MKSRRVEEAEHAHTLFADALIVVASYVGPC